ncbi:DUF4136 domain-containing protein [Leeuwenhoekiella polynyae]|uniref:DUF4136 domain-containing protein n=1 Tax=Leeuwenhoekiella polynyae TaxID=1550906 RepID=A0A4Q0NQR5_9FLAO|nr:DUF4136 domain-containing protein [Leeuwenhoekiella polynyae]RXG12500.1 putative protein DUF4136 [Leeuwenhoekiella polynyae]
MMKHFLFLVLTATLFSCGSTKVAYDYDEQIDFTTYKTYNYIGEMQTGMSQLDDNRLMDATDLVMQANGFSKSETPDLLINIVVEQYDAAPQNSVGIGVGGGSYGGGVSVGAGIPLGGRKDYQTITFDLVDARKDMLVWQAVSDSNVAVNTNPQDRVAYFTKIVQKVFSEFPPEK